MVGGWRIQIMCRSIRQGEVIYLLEVASRKEKENIKRERDGYQKLATKCQKRDINSKEATPMFRSHKYRV